MKLAIADPPYLGYADMWYGSGEGLQPSGPGNIAPPKQADRHPDAKLWDDPAQHRDLVAKLEANYDGWAIAMAATNVRAYSAWLPSDARFAIWHDPAKMPNNQHPRRRYEVVAIWVPEGRRRINDVGLTVGDVLSVAHNSHDGFAGAKPRAWTEWVLAMLGHCDLHDDVEDLFAGSGAVAEVLAQRRLTLVDCKCEVKP